MVSCNISFAPDVLKSISKFSFRYMQPFPAKIEINLNLNMENAFVLHLVNQRRSFVFATD